MSTCRWCTPGGSVSTDLIKAYAARELRGDDLQGANDDLSYCMECVVEYHRIRDEVPHLHKALQKLETSRLIAQLEKSMNEEIEDDDELILVEEDGEKQIFGYNGPNFESNLRVPLLEILKYPYLLLNKRVSELCAEALYKMEKVNNPFQVYEKLPGVYLLLVYPNETIRRWAIGTARAQGKVDRDDYYDLQEVFTCLFKVIELGLFENPEIYSSEIEEGKLILLPSHLYDTSNYKNYWLGICMLLTVLEEQAMDSLLLGPDKQNDFMQSILHVMEKQTEDESSSPFWPALHCFMMILDRLGSKVWGQLIDPIQAFQTIIGSPTYNREIDNIRNSYRRVTKFEADNDSDDDDLISCSQMVYSFNTEKHKKDTGWKNAICPDYCPNMYEEMQSLANVLQSDIGQDMRVHNSTFLWFVPFIQSVMDLKDLGVAYIVIVIHHLHSEIKDILNQKSQQCDKVTELFILVLVSIIELHRNKKCLHFLWVSSHEWVEAIVKCSLLPNKDFKLRNNKVSNSPLSSSPNSQTASVQYACIQLIRSLLREGYQLGQQSACKQYLDKLNLILRGNVCRNLELSKTETQGLQACLKQIIKSVKDHSSASTSSALEQNTASKVPSVPFIKNERVDDDDDWYGTSCSPLPTSEMKTNTTLNSSGWSFSKIFKKSQEARNSESGYPSCSSDFNLTNPINIKREDTESTNSSVSCEASNRVSSAWGTDGSSAQQDSKPKKELSGWQSKLSKVMKKASSLKSKEKIDNLVTENKSEKSLVDKSKVGLSPYFADVKKEQSDSGSDSDDSLTCVEIKRPKKVKREPFDSDNFPVTKQLEKMSLDHKGSEKNSRVLKNEADKSVGKTEFGKSCEEVVKPSSPYFPEQSNELQTYTDDDDVPLSEVREKLIKRSSTNMVRLRNSHVDRNLDCVAQATHVESLRSPANQSKESMALQKHKPIERKVKGAKRILITDHSPCFTDLPSEQIIITISDSSSEEEAKPIVSVKTEKSEMEIGEDKNPQSSISKTENKSPEKCETSSFACDEHDSQFFEFETDNEVYSVWEDSQADQTESTSLPGSAKTSTVKNNSPKSLVGFEDDFNQWGYDTDYISDDVIERAAEAAEEQIQLSTAGKDELNANPVDRSSAGKTSKHKSPVRSFYGQKEQKGFTKSVKMSSEKSKKEATPVKESHLAKKHGGKKTEKVVAQKILSKSKTNLSKSPLKSRKEKKRQEARNEAALAIVPPKKIHTCPEPTTTVEKLGLKKAPRKAFDLSQRSLDSLAELRNYGKCAGFVEAKRRRAKLISPQSLMVKPNKHLLACQDLQFYRQSKQRGSEKKKQKETKNNSTEVESTARQLMKKSDRGTSSRRKKDNIESEPSTSKIAAKPKNASASLISNTPISENGNANASVTKHNSDASDNDDGDTCDPFLGGMMNSSTSSHTENILSSVTTTVKVSNIEEETEDDDDLFLTQSDPVDMEICSQEEHDIDLGMFGDSSTSSGMATPSTSLEPAEKPKCKYADCTVDVKNVGDRCPKHTTPEKADDHVFAKPGLPPSVQKPARPSTTKRFSAGNPSRAASLTKELENIPRPQSGSKTKPTSALPPIPKLAVSPSIQNRTSLPQSTNGVLQPLINKTNIMPRFTSPPRKFPQESTGKVPQQMDQAWLMRQILQWKYEMFDQVPQFGAPNDLCQLPLLKVPLKFSRYDDYFNVFYPLMLLNTFESLVQDWTIKQRAINSYMCKLHLQNFCVDIQVNRGDFQAWIRDADLNRQRHPKEDDLVFLITSEQQSSLPGEEAASHIPVVYHTAYVSRFTRSQMSQNMEKEQYTLCNLCIHTYGNLSAYRNQQVQCVVIGNLITTQRQFRALLQLPRNPLFRPIVQPSPPDFMPKDGGGNQNTSFLSLKEYNSDQKNAIEKAYAMVSQYPRLPRICLIHGPPGTGKSKTIVGLLYRILMEQQNKNIPNQNFNVKNKRNRVLVCAPSNAAIDDLMKKIILDFKEKCQDKKNTLGNCGDINLVRLGSEKTISSDVVKFSLDSQVNYRINKSHQDQNIHRQREILDRQLDELSRQRAMERCNKNTCVQLDEQMGRLSKERQQIANSLKEFRRRPQEVQRNIILESHIICCTLSTSGGFLLESAFRQLGHEPFSCVIVDEAGQACEVETIIPLLHRCAKLVLVGDPEQLPPTVISVKAEVLGYGQSLMSRLYQQLENNGTKSPVLQLTVQYRMHPDICLFPSNYFYKRVLKTDRAIEEVRCSSEWPFQPYMVFDVADGYERKDRDSFSNPQEIKVVVALIKLIKSKMKEFSFRNIGVITPYRAQKMMIIDELRKSFGDDNRPGEVDTVDGFQGRQKDCIIVTCVRANSIQGCIGFLASRQRLNVTITRAKFSLFILGSLRTLMENEDWNHLIQDAQRRGALVKTREENYQRDVNKILKLKSTMQRLPFNPVSRMDERPDNKLKDSSPHNIRSDASKPLNNPPRETNNLPKTAPPPPPRAVVHPVVDYRGGSFPNLPSASPATTLPTVSSAKLRDPRLARRLEAEKAANASTSSASHQSNFDREQRNAQSRHLPSSVAGAKRPQEPALRDSRSFSDGDRGPSNWTKDTDYQVNRKPPEHGYDAKRRKVSH